MTWLFCCPGKLSEALSKLEIQIGRRQALAVLLGQILLGAIVAIVCLAGWGARAAVSAATGAGIGIAATALMAFAMLRHGVGASLQRVAWSFFSGWLVKVGFTVAALAVAFGSPKVDAVPLLAAYVTTFVGYWFGAARRGGPRAKQTVGVAD
jgi:F0F1-type ATP synthase assembly protein I